MKAGNEYMPSMLYREYVITALKQKDISGAEKFIENYTERLAPEFRDTLFKYSIGKINMFTKHFSAALKYYDNCPQNNQIINLDMKIDKLVALYELGNLERYKIELYKNKQILKTNKNITLFQKSSFKAYISIMEKLINIKLNPEPAAKYKLINEVTGKKILHHKDWILKQINEA